MITINGVAVDPSPWPSPELAAVRELLRQRAVDLGLLEPHAGEDAVTAGIEALLEREVTFPSPTEEECRRYYDAHPEAFRSGDLVFARHILFQVTPGAPVNLVRAKAEATLARVAKASDEFAACAKTLSNCPSGEHGGSLGQIGRGDTVPEFEEALFANKWIGILPRLVKTRYGFHIVAIDRRVEGRLIPFDVVRQRIAEFLTERVQKTAMKQYVQLLAGQVEVRGLDASLTQRQALDAELTPLVQ